MQELQKGGRHHIALGQNMQPQLTAMLDVKSNLKVLLLLAHPS
jgi:hypothetical protein